MFNWICPQCGSEVLASYAECPECAKRTAQPAPPAQPAANPLPAAAQTPPPQPAAAQPAYTEPARNVVFTPPPAPAQPPFQPAAPQGYYMQPPRRGLPTWLMSILFSLLFVGLGAGVYWAIQHFKESSPVSASGTTGTALENPGAKTAARPSPYQKYVEVTGVRLFQNSKKQVEARFLIVNHSEGEMADLSGTVEIRGRAGKEEEPVGSFTFKSGSIGPNESKELTAKVDTKLKVYELPDWQNIDARVRITAP
jgi:hypothetical protein